MSKHLFVNCFAGQSHKLVACSWFEVSSLVTHTLDLGKKQQKQTMWLWTTSFILSHLFYFNEWDKCQGVGCAEGVCLVWSVFAMFLCIYTKYVILHYEQFSLSMVKPVAFWTDAHGLLRCVFAIYCKLNFPSRDDKCLNWTQLQLKSAGLLYNFHKKCKSSYMPMLILRKDYPCKTFIFTLLLSHTHRRVKKLDQTSKHDCSRCLLG